VYERRGGKDRRKKRKIEIGPYILDEYVFFKHVSFK
jgi:hypothetical protein